jgi:hypothetical protein
MRLPTRYAGWMVRDLAFGPGLLMAVLTLVAALLVSRVQVIGPVGDAAQAASLVVLDWTAIALTLLATGGVVSADFAIGHQRTLFAKPVSPPLYYLQRWLIAGVAVLIGSAVVAQTIASRFDMALLGPGFVARLALLYLVIGGLVFLMSTLIRGDWLAVAALLAWQTLMGMARSMGLERGPIGMALEVILPPRHLLHLGDPLPAGAGLVRVVVYGAAALLGALAVLRWRPLARGARE